METSHLIPIEDTPPLYQIWGPDHVPYGPVELPGIVNWIKDERVVAETWVYVHDSKKWLPAAQVPELKMFFQPKASSTTSNGTSDPNGPPEVPASALRRIKIFAEMDNPQLEHLVKFLDVSRYRPGTHVVRKGDPGDAMYLVLEGELRSCLLVDGIETPIATLPVGSLFGEISLLDQGPHAADVIANQESTLLRLTRESFLELISQAPQLGLAFVLNLAKSIAGRARILTKRYEDSTHLSQTAEVVAT